MSFQDMPPVGGFGSINHNKVLAKPIVRNGIWAGVMFVLTINGLLVLREHRKRLKVLDCERTEHYIAVSPFLIAEQERLFLSHLHHLREDERELMKDHPGWKVGTLYGERLYKTCPPNMIPPISPIEWTAHRGEWEWIRKVVNPDLHQ